MTDAYILDAVRTPIGRFGGALAQVRPDDLAAGAIRSLLARHPDLDPARIEDVILGNANGAGEENRNVARMAVLLAGLPVTVPGATVNRLCGSGLEAVAGAASQIKAGDLDLAVAGGVESMTRAPWVLPKAERAFPAGNAELYSTTLGWRMVNPAMPDQWTVSLGEGAEILVDEANLTRDELDEFAAASHAKADAAWNEGKFADEIVAVAGADLDRDECIRPGTTVAKLAGLKPAFRKEHGRVTAGNSSPLNDGAAALLVASEKAAGELAATPLCRVVARAASGIEPHRFGLGPVEASTKALQKAGIGWDDVDLVELNEAFASQSLACLRGLPDLDPAKVNVNGGAIAIGHPLGASGARILTTLVHELRRRGGRYGLATMCIGVGQGIALVVDAQI